MIVSTSAMKEQKLTEFSNEKLIKEEANAKLLLATFIVSVTVMIALSFYSFFTKGFSLVNLSVLLFTPIAVMLWKNYQAVKKEIGSRRF